MATKVASMETLKRGQTVRITREVEIASVDKWDRSFRTKDNRTIRVAGVGGYQDLPAFNVEVVKDVVVDPRGWPPAVGDVWRDDTSKEYHILANGNKIQAWDSNNNLVTSDAVNSNDFKTKAGLRRVYRKGAYV